MLERQRSAVTHRRLLPWKGVLFQSVLFKGKNKKCPENIKDNYPLRPQAQTCGGMQDNRSQFKSFDCVSETLCFLPRQSRLGHALLIWKQAHITFIWETMLEKQG